MPLMMKDFVPAIWDTRYPNTLRFRNETMNIPTFSLSKDEGICDR